MDQVVFTPAALLDFLSQVEELRSFDVSVSETPDGNIQVIIGDSVYSVDCSDSEQVNVSSYAAEKVSDVNEEAYEDLVHNADADPVDVQAGLIAEAVKTLAVGGLVRIAGKLVKDYMRS